MHKKLTEIISKTKEDLLKRKKNDKSFYQAMVNPRAGKVAVIAEIKLASPNEGLLGNKNEIETRIKKYEQSEVDAISVVTEKHFFKGDPELIKRIKKITSLPILQKDFVIDEYQIYEAKIFQADALLLIAQILSEQKLVSLVELIQKIGIEPVVEINNKEDLKKALKTKTNIIAVNARDLDTFEVNVDKACELLKRIPEKFIKLGFSGIHSRTEVEKYKQAGAKAVLVGTGLMKTKNINKFIKELKNVS